MSLRHNSSIIADSSLLLNLDFMNPKRFNAFGSNLLQDPIYNASTWGTFNTIRETGINAPDGSSNAVRVKMYKLYGTYTITSNVATITIPDHSQTGGNHYFDFTSGTGVDNFYNITVVDTNTFTIPITAADGSGNVIFYGRSGMRINHTAFTPNGTDTYVLSFWARYVSGGLHGSNILSADLSDGTPSTTWTTTATSNPGKWVQITATGVPTATSKSFLDILSDTFGDMVIDFWGAKLENKTVNTYTTQIKDTIRNATFDVRRTDYATQTPLGIQFTRSSTANTTKTVTNYIGNGTTTVTCTTDSTTELSVGQAFTISGSTADTNLNGTWTIATVPNSTTFTFFTSVAVASGTFTTGLGTLTVSSKWGGLVISNPNMTGDLTNTNFLYNDHTWEVWFRIDDRQPSSLDTTEGYSILACYPGWHSGFLYTAGTILYGIKNGATLLPTCASWTLGASGAQINQGSWYQIVVTRTGNVFTPYVNGVPLGTGTTTVTDPTNNGVTNTLSIGSSYQANAGWGRYLYYSKNTVSNMKMYNRALSAAEVKKNFNALRGRFGI